MQADGGHVDTPDAPPYLLGWMQELGWCAAGGMGAAPLPAVEIAAWARGSGRRLQAWEFLALQEASRTYVANLHNEDPVPPGGERIERPSVAGQFKKLASQINKTP